MPRWEEGRQARDGCGWKGRAMGSPPCLGVESGPGRPGLEAWVQDPAAAGLGSEVSASPRSGPLSVAWIGLFWGAEEKQEMLCDFEFSFLIPGSFERKNVRCHGWVRGLENGLEC